MFFLQQLDVRIAFVCKVDDAEPPLSPGWI